MTPAPLYGLVLAGGRSRRMGQDKTSLAWAGTTLREHQVQLLSHHLDPVFLSCRPDQTADFAGIAPLIPDQGSSIGPMSGLLAAWSAHPAVAWLVIPVDMPYLTARELDLLIERRDPSRLATLYRDPDGRWQPLVAIWEPASADLFRQAQAAGNFKIQSMIQEDKIEVVPVSRTAAFHNLNHPWDLPA